MCDPMAWPDALVTRPGLSMQPTKCDRATQHPCRRLSHEGKAWMPADREVDPLTSETDSITQFPATPIASKP